MQIHERTLRLGLQINLHHVDIFGTSWSQCTWRLLLPFELIRLVLEYEHSSFKQFFLTLLSLRCHLHVRAIFTFGLGIHSIKLFYFLL